MTRSINLSHNPPLRRAFANARRDANLTGRPCAVLNHNATSGLYEVRFWEERYANSHELVGKVEPDEALS